MKQTKTICDRCGEEIIKPFFPFIKIKQTIPATNFLGDGDFDYSDEKFELCTKCSKDFGIFMKGGNEDDESYFKVFRIAADDKTGEPDYDYIKINHDVTAEWLAKYINVDLKNVTQITAEEYEEDIDE